MADTERARWLELLSYIEALIYNEREIAEQEALLEKVTDAVQDDVHRKEVFDMGKTIAEALIERGHQKGHQEGLQQGAVQNQHRMLIRLLRTKFGKIPATLVKRIEATEQLDLLDAWFDRAVAAKTLIELSFDAQ